MSDSEPEATSSADEEPAEAASSASGDPPALALGKGRIALFVAVWLLIGAVVAEVGIRLTQEEPAPGYYQHPHLRRVRGPEAHQRLVNQWTGKPYTIHVDAHGFRCRTLAPPGAFKPPNTYRIFFVGASTTENLAIPDEQTFPVLVEESLNQRLKGAPRVVAVNTALSGNSVADSLSLIAHRILALQPDLIVVLHASNDMRATLSSRFDQTHYRDRIPPHDPGLGEWFQARSRLVGLVGRVRKRLRTQERIVKYRARRRAHPFTPNVDARVGVPYFLRYLGMISVLCKQAGVSLALMTQPTLYKDVMTEEEDASLWLGWIRHGRIGGALNLDTRTLLKGQRAFNDVTRSVAERGGHLLIDLAAKVPRDLDHFYDDAHYTPKGNEVVAEQILADLLISGRLP